jgi:SRSO17 transposase
MLLHVPASLDGLLVLLRPCFSQPTFQTFRGLLVGQVCQIGQRTVCGMLVGARLSGVWHHARAHRFFSHARWRVDELGLRIAELVVARLCEPDAPVLVAVDDTLLHRLGRKVHGTFWHHDATANSRQAAVAWGNNWVVVGIVVRPVFLDRAVCLPVLFRLWQPKRKEIPAGRPDPQRPSKPVLARELIDLLAARLTARTIHVVGDAAYATSAARGLPGRVTMTSRLRSNAALYAPAPPRTGKRGRPATWGARLANLAAIAADPATAWTAATVRRYAKTETVMLHEIDCLWGPLGAETPVRVILIQDTTRASGYQIALITTDPDASPTQIIERYADRWPIEVCYEDAKHVFGVGHARNRSQRAVQRTVPFQFLTMTLTILWYALAGHHPDVVAEHRARAPWYLSKANPSTADMLAKLRRTIIAAQYHPGQARTPSPAQITQVQHAWAAAGI